MPKKDEQKSDAFQADDESSEETRTSRTGVLACRMPRDEIKLVEEAAAEAGETTSEYVRKALVLRRSLPTWASASIAIGSPYMQASDSLSLTRATLIVKPDSYQHTVQSP